VDSPFSFFSASGIHRQFCMVALPFEENRVSLHAAGYVVLDEKLQDRKTIKQLIKNWKAGELRA
jgi:hypothetical protein